MQNVIIGVHHDSELYSVVTSSRINVFQCLLYKHKSKRRKKKKEVPLLKFVRECNSLDFTDSWPQ